MPFNQNLTEAQKTDRLNKYFYPYHQALGQAVQQLQQQHGEKAMFVSIHSFTPALKINPDARPWEISVLWRKDRTTAQRAKAWLEQNTSLVVGDNQPYSALAYPGYTLAKHVEDNNLRYVLIEIRDDQIRTPDGQLKLAYILIGLIKYLTAQN